MKESIYRYPNAEKYNDAKVNYERKKRVNRVMVLLTVCGTLLLFFLVNHNWPSPEESSIPVYSVNDFSEAQFIYHFTQGNQAPVIYQDRERGIFDTISSLSEYIIVSRSDYKQPAIKPKSSNRSTNAVSLTR